jgi:hypothetical protein
VISEKVRLIPCGGRSYSVTIGLAPSEYGQQIVFTSALVRGAADHGKGTPGLGSEWT